MNDPGLAATAALSRAQAALSNAGAAVASLAGTVVEAHAYYERELADREMRVERRERELAAALDRQERDDARRRRHLDARDRALASGERALASGETPTGDELRRAYRRGYETGYSAGKTGRRSDPDRALADPRNRYTTSPRRAAPREARPQAAA